ncbi:response regulator [uncultured Rhodoblastus sp.]|uniref:response regulator transcription factor n=1 Tax=uncultured Rhodoblastus sp. TaxID=543037 RepID=UPI0025F6A9FA|nr:response regulator [uncultured Rhodoblastus sp.]
MAFDQNIPVIHVIDDDPALLDSLNMLLTSEGYAVRTYASARIFLETDWQCESGCILTDVHMPEMSGLDLLAALAAQRNDTPVIVLTGRADAQIAVSALKLGAFNILSKLAGADALLASIDAALKLRNERHPLQPASFVA